eukprot:GHVP01054512.1.p1 GENE.GHVP01054512.1~~GHVP01054512.1.p1  ORF type:complete len:103 (-),score=20.90 GHVP01054512.1:119-427(-)
MIRKEVYVSESVMEELQTMIRESELLKEDDEKWPLPDVVGKQELEIILDGKHKQMNTQKLGSLGEVHKSNDPEGLKVFYYLVQDLKCFVFSLIGLHFRIQPV